MKKLKIKTKMLRKKRTSHKVVELVLRTEGSLWWERFEEKVGLEMEVKERGTYGRWEWWVERVRRCGRSVNRQVRDRGTGMKLTERTRKLIVETWWGIPEGTISYAYRGWCRWSSKGNQRWRASAARRLNRDEVMQIRRFGGCMRTL